MFYDKRSFNSKVECSKCFLNFKSVDYFELHAKIKHQPRLEIPSELDLDSEWKVCLADLCDIFECREVADKILKNQVFVMRKDFSYEGLNNFNN